MLSFGYFNSRSLWFAGLKVTVFNPLNVQLGASNGSVAFDVYVHKDGHFYEQQLTGRFSLISKAMVYRVHLHVFMRKR